MTYELVWCPQMGMFGLSTPMGGHRTMTTTELRESFADNAVLHRWADFAVAHPNVRCVYDMLPPSKEAA